MTLRLPKIFADGCVLQAEQPVPVWGWAECGATVTVSICGGRAMAVADRHGSWNVKLDPLQAGGPFTLSVESGKERVEHSCYAGEVFLCSGQSNMELPMGWVAPEYPSEFEHEPDPLLRQYKVVDRYDFDGPVSDHEEAAWLPCDRENLSGFSAVAYFFGRAIRRYRDVPVGLLNVSLGGSPIEAWMDADTLQRFPEALRELEPYLGEGVAQRRSERSLEVRREWLRRVDELAIPEDQWQWHTMTMPTWFRDAGLTDFRGRVEFRRTVYLPGYCEGCAGSLRLGTWTDSSEIFVNDVPVGATTNQYEPLDCVINDGVLHAGANEIRVRLICERGTGRVTPGKAMRLFVGDESFDVSGLWRYAVTAKIDENCPWEDFVRWKPTGLYNAMLAPCIPYGIRAVLWYQGESNTGDRASQYDAMLEAMIALWRDKWRQTRLPFLIVQLPSFAIDCIEDGGWPLVREAEHKVALDGDDVATVVTLDAGSWNDLHPCNKRLVASRLFDAARALVYGEAGTQPEPSGVAVDDGFREVTITFVHRPYCGGDLAHMEPCGLSTLDGAPPAEFEYVWSDGMCAQAVAAAVAGHQVHIALPDRRPTMIRYAWSCNPHRGLLCDAEGTPVSPFRIRL